MRATILLLAASLACAAGPSEPRSSPVATSRADAGTDGGAAAAEGVPDGGARPLPLLAAEALRADGGATPLSRDGLSLVDPGSGFRLAVGAELTDARLALLDAGDAAVPSAGTMEIGAVSRFSLSPAEPLRPGSSYLLRLDGATSRAIHGVRGETFAPLVLQVRATGEPPPARHRRGKRVRSRR